MGGYIAGLRPQRSSLDFSPSVGGRLQPIGLRNYVGDAVAIFARAPAPGKAKTRLIPLLGRDGAARFQATLLGDSLRKLDALTGSVARYLFLSGCNLPSVRPRAPRLIVAAQRGANLGERLERAFRQLLRRHARAVVMGTDSPALSPARLRLALGELRVCDAVLGPCPDGGYYLIGLRGLLPGVWRGVRWGSTSAFRDTLHNLTVRGLSCSVLEPLEDIDRPADFRRLAASLRRGGAARDRRLSPAVWRFIKNRCSHVA